jgi:putative lipoprotein
MPGLFLLLLCPLAEPQPGASIADLYGTEWSLVRFEGGDGMVLIPADSSAYTVSFATDQSVRVRIDCNGGQGQWKSNGPHEIEFTPLVLTWAQCADTSLDARIPNDFQAMQSYALKDNHLFLFLKANRGDYEFVPRSPESGQQKEVKGTISYRERSPLPPGAVVEMTLEDTSKADAPPAMVARVVFKQSGSLPIPFAIPYDPSAIDSAHRYLVLGRILAQGQLLFSTDQAQPVLTDGAPSEISLLLRPVGPESLAKASSAPVALEGTHWKLTKLEGADLLPTDSKRIPYLTLDRTSHRVSGFSGCNRLVGSYELDGNKLTFGATAGTRMACLTGMDLEQHFTEILSHVDRWKIDGHGLDLLDSNGNPLAHFEATPEGSDNP